MEVLKDYIKKFFETEKRSLEDNYPGINYHILLNELYSVVSKDQIENLYIPSGTNPITKFFDKLKLGIPLPYITGRSFFYNSEFWVNPDVLVPRKETELLVEALLIELKKSLPQKQELKIVDVGAGSGNIIITLLQEISSPVTAYAIDISSEALSVCRKNFFHLRYTIPHASSLRYHKTDRFFNFHEKVDVVVTNPPYIMKNSDKGGVHHQVNRFEPHQALYLDDHDYFPWFSTLFEQALQVLNIDGIFAMEGHENHLDKLSEIALDVGFSNIELKKDLTGRKRFLFAKKITNS